jgi:hypothetical protein
MNKKQQLLTKARLLVGHSILVHVQLNGIYCGVTGVLVSENDKFRVTNLGGSSCEFTAKHIESVDTDGLPSIKLKSFKPIVYSRPMTAPSI